MPAAVVHTPRLEHPTTLVVYSCLVWLHQLLAEGRRSVAVGNWDAMLDEITTSADQGRLQAGLHELRRIGRACNVDFHRGSGGPKSKHDDAASAPDDAESLMIQSVRSDDVRLLIGALDDHLAREHPERVAHLLSFYASIDAATAERHEWVDPTAFASAWAAGPTRSKYEVLDRGRQAAALAQQFGDKLPDRLMRLVHPASPYEPPQTLHQLLTKTCDELIGVVSLPPASGAAAATRHLAVIGETALAEIRHHLFGPDRAADAGDTAPLFGSVGAWRLPRVLTRIGQLDHPKAVVTSALDRESNAIADAVWGRQRSRVVVQEAKGLLRRLLVEELPNINRPRSLTVEAYRYLDHSRDPELRDLVLGRVEHGQTVTMVDGVVRESPPFGEHGLVSNREQAYAALVLHEKFPELLPKLCTMLRSDVNERLFAGLTEPMNAARRYAAAFVEFIDQFGIHPPLNAFCDLKVKGKSRRCASGHAGELDARVLAWFGYDGTSPDNRVREAAEAVWGALRSAADGTRKNSNGQERSEGWTDAREHNSRMRASRLDVDRILQQVPIHARAATRGLVAQAVLSIDGTGRREAVEALRQAGLADHAAGLLEIVVNHCRALREGATEQGHPLDWVREQAVFCLSYTGSLVGFDTLVTEAGLTEGAGADGWGPLPGHQAEQERWIRTTALLGLADLGDALHDDQGELADARIYLLLERIEARLLQMASEVKVLRGAGGDRRRTEQLFYIERGAERRALVAVLAMLRSPNDASIALLHVLSGRCWQVAEGGTEGSRWEGLRGWARKERPLFVQRADAGPRPYAARRAGEDAWVATMKTLQPLARQADLVTWQLAEWGLSRIENRFGTVHAAFVDAHPAIEGVRLTDVYQASQRAERRMRRYAVDPPLGFRA